MKIGVTVRNMGPESTAPMMLGCARTADAMGFESLWITDHIAIEPDNAEGSGGRYTDPLVTLGWMAGQTRQIKLGTGVLIVPYRTALPTAKQIATLQELSGDRLLLGVGVGWMDAEFAALNVPRRQRGRLTDETLAFWHACFAEDEVLSNGQPMLFKPRPQRPPFLVGGAAPHALERACRLGDGWLPMVNLASENSMAKLAANCATYRHLMEEQGRSPQDAKVSVMGALPEESAHAAAVLQQLQELGVERLICAARYQSLEGYQRTLESVAVNCRAGGLMPG